MRFIVLAFAVTGALFAACGGDGEEAYDTYQDCFTDHTTVEKLPVGEAIVVCCLDHEIAGKKVVCGDTAPECVTYLTANLTTGATSAEISAACDDYVVKKGQ